LRVALAQVDCRLGEVDANVDRAEAAITEARGADVVVFPELSLTGYSVGTIEADLTMRRDDPRLLGQAEHAGDAAVLLGFSEQTSSGVHTFNSAAYFEAGALRYVHRKLYLPTYDIFEERKHWSPGQEMRAFDTVHGRVAVLTCNDAWQPQLPFLAAQDGAHVLYIPTDSAQSRFPEHYDSESYWRGITRFYARMFQVYVVFVNRVGTEGPLQFWGGSHVVDPWGEVIAQAPLGEEQVLTVDLDLALVRSRRRKVPLVKEARLGLLRRELDRLVTEGGDL
jgi:predicted amidohydrolase